jgi:hypothetical protein
MRRHAAPDRTDDYEARAEAAIAEAHRQVQLVEEAWQRAEERERAAIEAEVRAFHAPPDKLPAAYHAIPRGWPSSLRRRTRRVIDARQLDRLRRRTPRRDRDGLGSGARPAGRDLPRRVQETTYPAHRRVEDNVAP